VAGRLLRFKRCCTRFLSPGNIQPAKRVHAESFPIESDCFSGRPENMLLKVAIVWRQTRLAFEDVVLPTPELG
jgi:hypothetical protein